ncbi:MAG: hypothetical protein E6G60_04905 [Actinobacteria bacterium]|nr:MAG: hypothetical protein E6G60_04905 [Actinomycetota bacterium]
MLFVRETHHVNGERAREFESSYRDEWVPAVARDADARVLWYANQSHLTCFAYHVFTITALRDGAAWTRMLERIHCGDLVDAARALDGLRHDVDGCVMVPAGPPARDLTLAGVPVRGEHSATLFVEDTIRTRGREAPEWTPDDGTEAVAVFSVMHPTSSNEFVLWRRVINLDLLVAAITAGRGIGSVSDIEHVDSRLQRVSTWSPLA